MLQVYRDNSKVAIAIDTNLSVDCEGLKGAILRFSFECGQPYLADSLTRYIRRLLEDNVARVRKNAYNEGWADAKAKRAKQTHFSPWL